MNVENLSLQKQIETMETVIDQLRPHARANQEVAGTILVLKEVHRQLRGRVGTRRVKAMDELEAAVLTAKTAASTSYREAGQLIHVASTLIHHWPTVRQALEMFAEQGE
jgi:hypothetical protein